MDFKYVIKSYSRSRNIRLTVKSSGEVLISKPCSLSEDFAKNFLESKRLWVESCLKKVAERKNKSTPCPTRGDFVANRYKFQRFIRERLEKINSVYGFSYKVVSVKNSKTLFGSCSRRGNLNFSYRLSAYPEEVVDYVVAHELCHLKEFNHSFRFWALVEKAVPDYRRIRKILRKGSCS